MKRISLVSMLALFMQVVSFAQLGTLKDQVYLGMLLISSECGEDGVSLRVL